MTIDLHSFKLSEKEKLFSMLSENDWPFHSGAKITRQLFDAQIQNEYYTGAGIKTFLVMNKEETVGFIRLFDLGKDFQDDETPLFDLRLVKRYRGCGFGKETLEQAVDYVFETYTNKTRIEGTTRKDNLAMCKVFEACGFVNEARYRESWRAASGELLDTLGYGMLRRDWAD